MTEAATPNADRFAHHEFRDGEELVVEDLRTVSLHTPGHTPEHLSFLVYEKSRCGQPMAFLPATLSSSVR